MQSEKKVIQYFTLHEGVTNPSTIISPAFFKILLRGQSGLRIQFRTTAGVKRKFKTVRFFHKEDDSLCAIIIIKYVNSQSDC